MRGLIKDCSVIRPYLLISDTQGLPGVENITLVFVDNPLFRTRTLELLFRTAKNHFASREAPISENSYRVLYLNKLNDCNFFLFLSGLYLNMTNFTVNNVSLDGSSIQFNISDNNSAEFDENFLFIQSTSELIIIFQHVFAIYLSVALTWYVFSLFHINKNSTVEHQLNHRRFNRSLIPYYGRSVPYHCNIFLHRFDHFFV